MKFFTNEWLQARCINDLGCLIWQGQVSRQGSPFCMTPTENGKRHKVQVRRLVWEKKHGPIPEGMRVICTCANPRCLTCLRLADYSEIGAITWSRPDVRAKKIAAVTSTSRARGKLDMEKARYIRNSPLPLEKIAKEVGISISRASLVRRGLAWKEAANPFAGLGA